MEDVLGVRKILFLWILSYLFTGTTSQITPQEVFDNVKHRGYVQLNLLMVGQSGTGKTSCVNSIFNASVIPKKDAVMRSTTQMTLYRKVLPLKDTDLDLRIIDTVGYGDSEYLEREQAPIIQLLKDRLIRHKLTMQSERLDRAEGRIHLVIYFLDAHRFKGVDVRFIKKIIPYAKVAVVISKADSLTEKERDAMRHTVKKRLKELNAKVPDSIFRLDPYPVLCESRFYEMANFFWDVNNPQHSDLPDLRADIMIRRFATLDAYAGTVYTHFHGTSFASFFATMGFYMYMAFIICFAYVYAKDTKNADPLVMTVGSALVGFMAHYFFLWLVGASSVPAAFLSGYFMEEVNKYPPLGSVSF